MANDQSNTLLRKIESAHFDVSAYPLLEAFSARLAEGFAATVNEEIRAEIEVGGVRFTALTGKRSLNSKEGAYALFASQTANKAGSVLVSVAANFAGAVAEAMFGGEFLLNGDDKESTDIDVAILAMTLNKVLMKLAGEKSANAAASRQPGAMAVAPVSFASAAVSKFENSTLCNITFDLSIGEAQAEGAVTFHFPMDYLDAMGLLEKGRKREVEKEEDSRWRNEMKSNVENSEIQLDIVLGSFSTRLSELTDLSVGETILIGVNADTASQIVLKTTEGDRVIGKGRLGAYKENKAIKLLGALQP